VRYCSGSVGVSSGCARARLWKALQPFPPGVLESEGGKAILLDVGTGEHGGFDLGLLLGIEPPRAPRAPPVVEASEPFGIEALTRPINGSFRRACLYLRCIDTPIGALPPDLPQERV
jgi:hypothetical protein